MRRSRQTAAPGLQEKLEALAESLVDRTLEGDIPKKGEVETFKILAGFFVSSRSKGLGADGEEADSAEGAFSFAKTKSKLFGQDKEK